MLSFFREPFKVITKTPRTIYEQAINRGTADTANLNVYEQDKENLTVQKPNEKNNLLTWGLIGGSAILAIVLIKG